MNTSVNTNVDFGTNSSNTNTTSSINSTPNNSSPTYQNTYNSNGNVQTESMDLSFATEQVATESKSILDSIGDFFSDVGEGLKNTGAAIVDGAKTVANWAITGIKDLGSSISEACSNLASNVSSILGSALSWAKDTYISLQATSAVIGTTVVSGIADIGEGIVDGLTWCGGKLVEGGSWLVGKVAGWFSDDAEEAVMEWREQAKTDVKEFIATDWVGEANDWFYQETALGRYINENSYLKYDSEAMQKLRGATEMVGKLVLATAASCLPGGAAVAVPLLLGFSYGTGEQAEKMYQENMDTTGAQELGIFVSGLGEAANWYAQGQLGKGGVGLYNIIKGNGLKNTGALVWTGIKSTFSNIKSNGLKNTIAGILKNSNLASLKAKDNLLDSLGIIGDNVGDWLVGDEDFNIQTATSAGGELLSAWLLNMFFDGAGEYLGNLGKEADDVGDALKQADDIEEMVPPIDSNLPKPKNIIKITDVPEFHSIDDISSYLNNTLSTSNLKNTEEILFDTTEVSEAINKYIREQVSKNGDSISLYYDLFEVSGAEIPKTLRTQIMGEIISSSQDLRRIIKETSLQEVKDSIGGTLGITDESLIKELSDCLLGSDFVENGYSATRDWDRFIEILTPYVDQKVAQGALSKEAVLWSKVDTKLLNELYTTIENTTIGESLYCFEDIVFTNWNESSSVIPHAEELWGKLSEMYAKSCSQLVDSSGNPIDQLKYILPSTSDGNGFGELFKKSELPTLLEYGTINKLEVVTVADFSDLIEVSSKVVDISGLRTIYQEGLSSGASKEVLSELIFEMFTSLYSNN